MVAERRTVPFGSHAELIGTEWPRKENLTVLVEQSR